MIFIRFTRRHIQLFSELLFVLLISLIPLVWFRPRHLVLGLDSGYPIEFIGYFKQRLYTWFSSQNFGVDNTGSMGQTPLHGIQAVLQIIGISYFDVQKVTFVIWFFAISISFYIFIRYLFPLSNQWIVRITALVVYVFNFFIFSFWLQGSQTTLSMYVLLPIVVVILIKYFKHEFSVITSALLLAVCYFVFNAGGIYGIPLLGSVIFSGLTVTFYYIFHSDNKKKEITKLIFLGVVTGFTILLLNAYFLLPFLFSFAQQFGGTVSGVGGVASAIGWTKYISEYSSFLNIVRFQGDNSWYDNPNHYGQQYLENPILIVSSFVFPILAFGSYIFAQNKKDKSVALLFILIAVVGIFLSAGAHSPFGNLYLYMMEKIPGFAAFRSAYYKFVPIVFFSFAVLIGISMHSLAQRLKLLTLKVLVCFLFLSFYILYHYPFFDKGNFVFERPFSTLVEIPEYVFEFGKYQNTLKDDNRTLVVPPLNTWPMRTYKWNYWGPSSVFTGLTNRSFVQNDAFLNQNESELVLRMYDSLRNKDFKEFKKIAAILNINSLVLTEDVLYTYSRAPSENPKIYKTILEESNDFKKIWEKGPWSVYSWDAKFPKIYAVNSVNFYKGDLRNIPLSDDNNVFTYDEKTFLPVANKITSYTCASCYLFDLKKDLDLSFSRIHPESWLYPFKLGRERQQLESFQTQDERIDFYLGLSLKRAGELMTIPLQGMKKSPEDKWKKSISLYSNYWSQIYEYLNTSEISMQKVTNIYKYAVFEEEHMLYMYKRLEVPESNSVRREFAQALLLLNNVIKTAEEKLYYKNIGNIYTYDTDQIYGTIKITNFPKNANNELVYPSIYEFNEVVASPSVDVTGNTVTFSTPKNLKKLSLIFDIPNLFILFKKNVQLPGRTESCIYTPIKNYSWNKKYLIQSKIENKGMYKRVYVKTNNDTYVLGDDSLPSFGVLDLSKQRNRAFTYFFKGKEYDEQAEIYFCVDSSENPEDIFSKVSIKKIEIPIVYSANSTKLQNKSPEIVYKKSSSTQYKVSVKNATNPYILVFNERYSDLWAASIEGKNINEKNETHLRLQGYAQGWYIDKAGNYEINIEFKSQAPFFVGLLVSLISLCSITLYFLYKFLRRLHK